MNHDVVQATHKGLNNLKCLKLDFQSLWIILFHPQKGHTCNWSQALSPHCHTWTFPDELADLLHSFSPSPSPPWRPPEAQSCAWLDHQVGQCQHPSVGSAIHVNKCNLATNATREPIQQLEQSSIGPQFKRLSLDFHEKLSLATLANQKTMLLQHQWEIGQDSSKAPSESSTCVFTRTMTNSADGT